MELFSILEEKQLVKKIYAVHDKIFSHPAKHYTFCYKTDRTGVSSAFGYYYINDNTKYNVTCTDKIPEQVFGEKTVIVMFEKYEECECDVFLTKRLFDGIEYDHIIAKADFLHHRQLAVLYREALEHYNTKQDFKGTDLIALEYTLTRMEEEKKHGRTHQKLKRKLHLVDKCHE